MQFRLVFIGDNAIHFVIAATLRQGQIDDGIADDIVKRTVENEYVCEFELQICSDLKSAWFELWHPNNQKSLIKANQDILSQPGYQQLSNRPNMMVDINILRSSHSKYFL